MRAIMPNPLPDSFLFGVATSDHQGEAFNPATPDIWDEWERKTKRTPRGRGTDFWNRFEQDVKLAAGLGCKVFRFLGRGSNLYLDITTRLPSSITAP
jgi:beta-glucosidase/6-phospho-beta-glucosidase/beta-galactosidase